MPTRGERHFTEAHFARRMALHRAMPMRALAAANKQRQAAPGSTTRKPRYWVPSLGWATEKEGGALNREAARVRKSASGLLELLRLVGHLFIFADRHAGQELLGAGCWVLDEYGRRVRRERHTVGLVRW